MQLSVRHEDTPPAEWPNLRLDVAALLRSGWHARPFQQFILKVASRCNLACEYCYVYQSVDQSWRDQPTRMSRAVAIQTAQRIAEHVRTHALSRLEIVLHGGEPLLAGPELLAFICTTLGSAMPDDVELRLYLQTNGTLLDRAVLEVFLEHDVHVGVSLDGDPVAHDASRARPNGHGSHADVECGLRLLRTPPYRHLFAGLLCVVDPERDPVATYEHLIEHEPPAIDLLLPHANWSTPPARATPASTPHGNWLIDVFDRWYDARAPETSVRLFEEIIRGLVGQPSRVESIGLQPVQLVVVETDGSIEQIDALKSAYDGAAQTGLHVDSDPFDAALALPQFVARQIGPAALDETCQRCELLTACGGGYYPHRYRRGTGFRNPSVYCADLTALITHVAARIRKDIERAVDRAPA